MKRKFLAALLALVMVFSMIPVSASAAEHFETGPNGYFTLSYENGAADQSFKVVIVDPEGTQVDSITVNDAATTTGHTVISLTEQFKNKYDIESVNVNEGTVTLPNLSADSYSFDFSPDIWGRSVVTVTLCPQFEAPTIIGDKVSGTTIRYIAEEPDLLKLVYMNEGKVNSTTTIDAVSMHFVEPVNQTGMGADWPMTDVSTSADNLAYFDASVTADWVDDRVQPDNIRYLEISYTTDGEENTVRVYSGDLRYVVNGNIYYIQSDDDSQYIVTFYNHEGASLHEWTLYDVKFVTPGTSIGTENMPANPTYPESSHYYFTNWTDGPNGGNTFLANTVINDDTVVYAQKHTTTSAPSEIHVINYEGELVNRFVELYNANHPDSPITANDIAMDTVKISVFGIDNSGEEYYTNPDYSTADGPGGLKNRWIDDDEYYFVYNYLSGAGSAQNDQITNTNEITKFEMSASSTTGESLGTITVNRGTDAGDFEITMGGGSSNYAIEIRINKTPTAPTDEDLLDDPNDENDPAILGKNAVKVTCTNNEAEHKAETYGLIANTNGRNDSYTIGAVTALAGGGYTCTITVNNEPYVAEYGENHTLAENEPESQNIVLTWDSDSNTWIAPSELPVNFNVTCTTEPGGGPEAPDVKIQVLCTNIEHSGIAQATYDLIEGTYEESMSKIDNVYTYSVTVSADKYVSRFSTESSSLHKLDSDYPYSDTIVYTYDGGSWQASGKDNLTFFVTCAEGGEEQPETPPTIDEDGVIDLMGSEAIKVVCETEGSGHEAKTYSLIPESFKVGTVTKGEDGKYSCVITIDEDGILQYVDAYDEVGGSEHTAISFGPITFTITHDGTKWLQPSKLPAATIKVECVPDQEDELDEGDLNEILGGAITVQCISEEDHDYKILTADKLLKNAYSATKNANGTYTVTLDGDKYASAYSTYISGEIGENENIPHQLVHAEKITLTHDGIKWTYSPSPIVIEVTCKDDSGDEPDEPTPTPTPTPGPGGGDKPPYIPPVDPDDSGVSDLLNTEDHIQYLFGYPEGTFGPENNMTRAEVAQMFYNLLLDQDVTITKTFDDVPANAWYAKAVNTLASLGVVSGVGNGDFEPERSITRAEFTSIAMKFAEGKTGGTNIFSDVKSTDWFYRAVVNSTQYGWIHGYGDGTFRPNNPITRVEVTAIVNNMLGREADVDFVTEHYDELNHFSDLAVSHWGYYHIVEATNDHDYTKPSSGENWTELN